MLLPALCDGVSIGSKKSGKVKGGERTEVKGPDEEHVDAVDGGNVLHDVEGLAGLDLHHGQEGVVGLLQVLGEGRQWAEALRRDGLAEDAAAHGRELGGLDELLGLLDGAQQRYQNLCGEMGVSLAAPRRLRSSRDRHRYIPRARPSQVHLIECQPETTSRQQLQ